MLLAFLKNKFSQKTFKIASLFVILFGLSTFVFAQDPPPLDPDQNDPSGFQGTVQGFGWMGTSIQNPGSSEGGGGWLKFNCAPEDCSNNWGVRADMDENSPVRGVLTGQAWSNNYGWLDFSDDNVQSCWEANQGETFDGPAKILFPTGKIVGWGKFLAGDDFPTGASNDDGWDGCVSFSGVEYGVNVDLVTGVISGWAWGGPVVGWISFTNPECPFCEVTIVLDEIRGCTNPTATNYNPLATIDDGSCRIIGCMDPAATNYNPLATSPGRCSYGPPVRGCTDSTANNYNPLATIDDGSCTYGPGGDPTPTLSLTVNPDTFTVGQPNVGSQYIAGPTLTPITWTSNNPSAFVPNSCQGTFFTVSGGLTATATLPGWSGPRVNPNSSLTNVNVPMAATATAGTAFRFGIRCMLVAGGSLEAFDQINMIDPIDPPTEPPSIWLHIEDPNIDGSLVTEVIPPWDTVLLSGGVDPLTLRWQALNVDEDSCIGESVQYVGPNAVGANSVWDVLPLGLDILGYGTLDLNVTSEQDIRNTRFQIKCHPLNAPTTWISAQVCMRVDGQTFPQSQCSAGNSINRPPGYKEI